MKFLFIAVFYEYHIGFFALFFEVNLNSELIEILEY